jgi:phosphoribosylformylglycinamidine synthase
LGSQVFASHLTPNSWGRPPFVSLRFASNLQKLLAQLADLRLITSAQDVSDGGIAVALARACIGGVVGADIDMRSFDDFIPVKLFWERANHVVVTCKHSDVELVERFAAEHSYIAEEIGVTGTDKLNIKLNGVEHIAGNVNAFTTSYKGTLESQLAAEMVTA